MFMQEFTKYYMMTHIAKANIMNKWMCFDEYRVDVLILVLVLKHVRLLVA